MGHLSDSVPVTGRATDTKARVKVDVGDTGTFMGRTFRAYIRINKAYATVQYIRLVATTNFILKSQHLALVNGAAEMTAWLGATEAGTWPTPGNVPIIGVNRTNERPKYPDPDSPDYYQPQTVITTVVGPTGSFSGGTEVDVLQANSGANQGVSSSRNVDTEATERALPPGTYYLKIGPISGINSTDQVIGTYSLIIEERPYAL